MDFNLSLRPNKVSVCLGDNSTPLPEKAEGRGGCKPTNFPIWHKAWLLIAQLERIHLQCRRPQFDSWVGDLLEKDSLPTPVFLDFPWGSTGKESACNVGDLGLIPGLGRSSRDRKGYPVQYSGLENSMDCEDHGVAKSQTQLSDFHFTLVLCRE